MSWTHVAIAIVLSAIGVLGLREGWYVWWAVHEKRRRKQDAAMQASARRAETKEE